MSVPRLAVFTIALGDQHKYTYCLQSIRRYAERVGADYILHESSSFPASFVGAKKRDKKLGMLEKHHLVELVPEYDRVLFLDADVFVSPLAPNVFEAFPDDHSAYLFDESPYCDHAQAVERVCSDLQWFGPWRELNGRKVQYNAGVMLLGRKNSLMEKVVFADMEAHIERYILGDQPYLNFLIQRYKIPVKPLSWEYNCMSTLPTKKLRKSAFFIHYAGRGFGPRQSHYWQAMCDYARLSGPDSWKHPGRLRLALETLRVICRTPIEFVEKMRRP